MKTYPLLPLFLGLVAMLAPAHAVDEHWFPFALKPGADGAPCRGEIDLTYLNEAPAGKSGFVRIDKEKFVDGAGKEVRLFGTNIVAEALFPTKENAERFAAHLASVGLNVVRCHFLDNQWGGASLLKKPDYKTWDLEALDRFHYFCAALKKRGIYLNLNMHVGRTYDPVPKGAPDFSKGLDLFYPPYTKAFQEYCEMLLTTLNPYTKLKPVDDPAVAVIELNNENTLVMNPWWMADLPEPYKSELVKQWNGYLKAAYATDEKLEQAYGRNNGQLGPERAAQNIVEGGGSPWRRDNQNSTDSTLEPGPDGGVHWEVKQPGKESWSHQLCHGLKDMKKGERWQLSFKARANKPRKMSVNYMLDEAPYSNAGLSDHVELDSGTWKEFQLELTAGDVDGKRTRITFSANNTVGWIELKDVSLRSAAAGQLTPEQSLAKGTVALPKRNAAQNVRSDYFHFLAEVEIRWAKEQIHYLKTGLGVKVPVAHSQVLFGGMVGARRESMVSDFIDTHGYWQHPDFTGKAWDMKQWEIGNTSQLLNKEGGTLLEMAMQRPTGKPYTVSEYDIPAPNDHAAELYPMWATVACEQQWAGLYSFCWVNGAKAYEGGRIGGFFDQCGHPAKEGFIATAALVYRQGMIQPHTSSAVLKLSDETMFDDLTSSNGDIWSSWRRVWKRMAESGSLAMTQRISLDITPRTATQDKLSKQPMDAAQLQSHWPTEGQNYYIASAPAVVMVSGQVANQKMATKDAIVSFGDVPSNGHATFTVVALDGKPIKTSKRLLVTCLCRAENENMSWNPQRNSVADKWGDAAKVLGVNAKLTFPAESKWSVVALDPSGRKIGNPATPTNFVEISTKNKTIWHLLER